MRDKKWLILLCALAVGLRCIYIEKRGIQYDDAFSIFLAHQNISAIIKGTAADTMPPLYYFLLHFWLQIGSSTWWLRALSVALNMGGLIFVYQIMKDFSERKAGLWAAFLFAISPLQIYHAQDIRMYALLEFLLLGYIYFFLRIWKKHDLNARRTGDWALLVVFGSLAMYTHNLAVFFIILPVFVVVIYRNWAFLKSLLIAVAGIGILFIPWLIFLPGQLNKIQNAFWTPRPGIVEIIQALIMFSANLPLPGIYLAIGIFLGIGIFIVLSIEIVKRLKQENKLAVLLIIFGIPPVLFFIISYLMRPIFVPRGFLPSAAFYVGLAGFIISKTWKDKTGMLIAGGFVLAAIISLPYQFTFAEFPRSPFAKAISELAGKVNAESIIVHDNKLSYFPCLYYNTDLDQDFIQDEPGSINDTLAPASQEAMQIFPQVNIDHAVKDARNVYFVIFRETNQEFQDMGRPESPNLAWLRINYHFQEKFVYNDLEVYWFSR